VVVEIGGDGASAEKERRRKEIEEEKESGGRRKGREEIRVKWVPPLRCRFGRQESFAALELPLVVPLYIYYSR
jgi:hypothetical protein